MSFRAIFGALLLGVLCMGAGCSSASKVVTTQETPPPPSLETILKMSPDERETALQSYIAQHPPKALTPDELIQEASNMRQIVENGQVKRIARVYDSPKNAQGEMRIVEKDGKMYLAFSEAFSMDPGPFLTIEISDQISISSETDLQKGVHFVVGKLRSPVGGQVYELPPFDLTRMTSLVIHSNPFQTIYAVANFEQPL